MRRVAPTGFASVADVLDERADAEAGGALRDVGAFLLREDRACDVEVRPLHAGVDELLQEQRCGDRAAVALADVLEIGDVALELLAELGLERHAPESFAALLPRSLEALRELLIVDERAGDTAAERDHARAGERREIDDLGRLELLGVSEDVGEDEAAFGVGVEHFDGEALLRAEDVAGADGAAV